MAEGSARTKLATVALVIVGFALGFAEFIVIGITPDIAEEYGISLASAGNLVGFFAISYAVSTPVIVLSTGRFRRFPLFVTFLAVFNALEDLMVRVRASSTLPVVMPPVHIGDHVYYDGGLGVGAGIPLQLALDSGCPRVLAVLTRAKGFRKPVDDIGASAKAIANSYHRYPKVKEALLTRNKRYNAELEKLEALAEEGKAYIVYADKMAVSNSTTDLERLRASYFDGYNQYQDQLPEILEWLKAGE